MTLVYKLYDRPHKTSLAATEIKSSLLESAGGSWTYEEQNGGTLWTQVNTLVFKRHFGLPALLPFYKFIFERQMKEAMGKAMRLIEY